MKPIKTLNGFTRSLRSQGFKVIASFVVDDACVKIAYPHDILVSKGVSPHKLFKDLYLSRVSFLDVFISKDSKFVYLSVIF